MQPVMPQLAPSNWELIDIYMLLCALYAVTLSLYAVAVSLYANTAALSSLVDSSWLGFWVRACHGIAFLALQLS